MFLKSMCMLILFATLLSSCTLLGPSNSEAVKQAENVFLRDAAKCGDSYFRKKTGLTLYEFRDVIFSVNETDLTEADRRNGTEWKGLATVSSKVERWYDPMNNKWSDWRAPQSGNCGQFPLEKRHGKWIGSDSSQLVAMPARSLRCDEIPK